MDKKETGNKVRKEGIGAFGEDVNAGKAEGRGRRILGRLTETMLEKKGRSTRKRKVISNSNRCKLWVWRKHEEQYQNAV